MNYKQQLKRALEYAEKNGSFSKLNMAENADEVCVYGLGKFFDEAFIQWNFMNQMQVSLLCDSNPEKWGKLFYGIKCISPEELFKLNKTKNILVVTFIGNPIELNKILKKQNIIFVNASDCIFEMICNMNRSAAWFKKNNILQVLDWLEDEESQKIYTNVLCNRIAPLLSKYDYDELYSEGEYFSTDIFKAGNNEYFVDGGAFDGDTIERLLKCTDGQFGHIYAFEMDKGNYKNLEENVNKLINNYQLPSNKISLYNSGIWDCNQQMPYGKENCGSNESFCLFKRDNIDYANMIRLDDILEKVSLIKMDIEGAEYNALIGAEKVIIKNRPKLAICIYHRLQDFWEIPSYIKSLVPQYKLYVRHHQNGTMGGTVLYAICR